MRSSNQASQVDQAELVAQKTVAGRCPHAPHPQTPTRSPHFPHILLSLPCPLGFSFRGATACNICLHAWTRRRPPRGRGTAWARHGNDAQPASATSHGVLRRAGDLPQPDALEISLSPTRQNSDSARAMAACELDQPPPRWRSPPARFARALFRPEPWPAGRARTLAARA
jgi:hypothetical protein